MLVVNGNLATHEATLRGRPRFFWGAKSTGSIRTNSGECTSLSANQASTAVLRQRGITLRTVPMLVNGGNRLGSTLTSLATVPEDIFNRLAKPC